MVYGDGRVVYGAVYSSIWDGRVVYGVVVYGVVI